jgi:hypothetical protein
LIAYKRTKDERFLTLIADSFEDILRLRDSELNIKDDFKKRVVNSWGSGLVKEGDWINHITIAGRITYPVSEFIYIVYTENLEKFKPQADRYLNCIKIIMDDFEDDYKKINETNLHYYYKPTTNNLEPINHVHAAGNTFVYLYKITHQEKYKNKVKEIARVFESNIEEENNESYIWNYYPKQANVETEEKSEPMWKAQITAPFVLYAYEAGIAFQKKDIEKIINTIRKNIIIEDEINQYISSEEVDILSKEDLKDKKTASRVCTITGFMAFGKYEPSLNKEIAEIITKRPDIFREEWLESPYMARGYAYLLEETDVH